MRDDRQLVTFVVPAAQPDFRRSRHVNAANTFGGLRPSDLSAARSPAMPQGEGESGHSICVVACHEAVDLMACHEGDFRLLKAGGSRIEWYRYGDSNPGVQTENLAS